VGIPAEPPDRGRRPTAHEVRAGQSWDACYAGGPAPWDIGGPQPAVARLAAAGALVGPVLDVGCGRGENALFLAAQGLAVMGTDVAETALDCARAAAQARGLSVEFVAGDALQLELPTRNFATVLDSGLFHTFDPAEQERYAASLAGLTAAAGRLYLLGFSALGPSTGPHPVSPEDIRRAFAPVRGWRVATIEPETLLTRFHPRGVSAWLARIHRA